MTRKLHALTSQMERLIETALMPGRFITDHTTFSFVSELGTVEARLAKLIPKAPAHAVVLYETFLAGCYEKAEEIDDSSGSFGQFVNELYSGWIKARQAAGADPDETATRLLTWMEDDPYGFCYDLERDAARVLNKVGLAALVQRIRERFDAAAATTKPAQGEAARRNPDYARRRWGGTLRTLYLEQKNVDAYLALAEQTGLTAEDCRALATMLVARRKVEDALSWVERGIKLAKEAPNSSMAGFALAKLKRDLFTKLGRTNEALDAAKKSKYYDAALSNFERARRCFEKAGLLAAWQRVVGPRTRDPR